MNTCQGCGTAIPLSRGGAARKWCSERCRKRQYDQVCIDCGTRVSGTDPGKSSGRCQPCAAVLAGAKRRVWTREAILDAIRRWATIYGQPPGASDWSPHHARVILGDDARARRWEEGDWPARQTAIAEFGTWNTAIAAAGFLPRRAGGFAENIVNRRARAAA